VKNGQVTTISEVLGGGSKKNEIVFRQGLLFISERPKKKKKNPKTRRSNCAEIEAGKNGATMNYLMVMGCRDQKR